MALFTSSDTNGYPTDYGAQEAAARRRRLMARTQYDYNVQELNRQASQNLADITQKYSKGMSPQITQYTGRGLGRSGIFQRAMKDYVTAQQQEQGNVFQNLQGQLGQLALGEQEAGMTLQEELDRIARQKNEEILNAAAMLKAWSPYAGLISG
jgi:hypothetical protein